MNSDELFELSNLLFKFKNDVETHWDLAIDGILRVVEQETEKARKEELIKKGITRRSPF
jgi:hypothetical protein